MAQQGGADPMASMMASMMGGGGGAGGMPGGAQGQELMGKLLPYIPTLLGAAKNAPAFIVGYIFTFIFYLVVYGPSGFKLSVAPVAGFHVVALVILAHVIPLVKQALFKMKVAKSKAKEVDRLSADIKLRQERLKQNDLD